MASNRTTPANSRSERLGDGVRSSLVMGSLAPLRNAAGVGAAQLHHFAHFLLGTCDALARFDGATPGGVPRHFPVALPIDNEAIRVHLPGLQQAAPVERVLYFRG